MTETTTQKSQVPAKRLETVRDLLEKAKPALAQALPRHITPDRMIRVALTAVTRNPLLLECDQYSLIRAVLQSAQLGLEPDSALGQAYLVPFYNTKRGCKEVQFIPGYRGLIDLARRSGQVASIEAHLVYEKDKFEMSFGLEPKLVHVPAVDEENPGEIRLVYAIVRFRGSGQQPLVEVMNRTQVEAIRKRSKAGEKGPWVTDWGEMARKTVTKRISKYCPMSPELARAIELDTQAEVGESQVVDAEILDGIQEAGVGEAEVPETTNNKTEALKNKLKKEKPEAKAEATEKANPKAVESLLGSFIGYNISDPQLEVYLGHSIDEMTAEECSNLVGIHAAIEKGDLNAVEVFPPLPEEEKGKEAESHQPHVFDRKRG